MLLLLVVDVSLMLILFKHSNIVVLKVDAVLVGVLVSLLPGGVSAGAVVTKDGQAPVVREGHEGAAAAALTLVVFVTKSAIAAIRITPDLAVGHAHRQLEVVE